MRSFHFLSRTFQSVYYSYDPNECNLNVKNTILNVKYFIHNEKFLLHLNSLYNQKTMETKFLLPHACKKFGWILLILSTLVWFYLQLTGQEELPFLETSVFSIAGSYFLGDKSAFFTVIKANITTTLIGSLFLLGGLGVAFSKEKIEDEFIATLRLESFQWSFLINYILLFLAFVLIYGFDFFYVMIYHMFTMLILFIFRFHYLLVRHKK